jgi:hypothetical protein
MMMWLKRVLLFLTLCWSVVALGKSSADALLPSHEMDYLDSVQLQVRGLDTFYLARMHEIWVYPKMVFKNKQQERFYWRTVRDVKKTLPIAREVRGIIIETYEYLLTLPDEHAREKHLAAVEKGLMAQYTPRMRQLTLSQGKMLIKLIDRECEQTGYELIRVFMGNVKAGFYQAFAALFGASLKRGYDPDGADAEIEEIIFWIEQGQL